MGYWKGPGGRLMDQKSLGYVIIGAVIGWLLFSLSGLIIGGLIGLFISRKK